MPTPPELVNFRFLEGIPDALLKEFLALAAPRDYAPGETIHEMDAPATHFYLFLDGKALLQVRMPPDIIVSLGSLKPGYCFGFSSLCPGERHDHTVVADRECRILAVPGEGLVRFIKKEPAFGVPFLLGMYRLVNDRLTLRTSQFLTLLTRHPDLRPA
ncbi:Crp/Fnr family transcriptional regulator [Desulfolutivibrio sulfoxidireducens]|uniref:Crp/Fnr family transcriptional regulator n=1 Tax=Desulfolutivibrio sulfoxidireducens TaxID=2773299 RepID=UPI00159D613A|nr:cyclic nucleotide-binding domain-containing protein [Desulfolutivibrio sulfoxidireducens]QLA17589.1 cyclic nucleotide-binding domain-containing protein [Desulfolutivibrio sulfoxidireducens]